MEKGRIEKRTKKRGRNKQDGRRTQDGKRIERRKNEHIRLISTWDLNNLSEEFIHHRVCKRKKDERKNAEGEKMEGRRENRRKEEEEEEMCLTSTGRI